MNVSETEEQQLIKRLVVEDRKNLVIAALAGCAKTTTLLLIADSLKRNGGSKKVLILTYNDALRKESCRRITEASLDSHVECHTYHSCTLRFFLPRDGRTDFHDSLIHDAIKTTQPLPHCGLEDFEYILVDEAQDLTETLCGFINHVLRFVPHRRGCLVLCGDPFQKIYGFRQTSIEFMHHPQHYFGANVRDEGKFYSARLSTCFRMSKPIADWVNTHFHPRLLQNFLSEEEWKRIGAQLLEWWGDGLQASRPGKEPTYIKFDWSFSKLALRLMPLYKTYAPHEVALLCYSGQSNNAPVWKLINELNKVYPGPWDIHFKENKTLENKKETTSNSTSNRVASTIHRFKGNERKAVIAFGIDAYYEKISSDLFETFCLCYVACTRARDDLTIIQCRRSRMRKGPPLLTLLWWHCNVLLIVKLSVSEWFPFRF